MAEGNENAGKMTVSGIHYYGPGLGQMKGFSPVWDRRWERSANLEVCNFPLRGQPVHSHAYFVFALVPM
jgi:hypothetical protein